MAVNILAIDNSATMRKVLEITFAAENAHVTLAASGQEGIEKAKEIQPDLVLVDVTMDGMDGYAVVDALKSDAAHKDAVVLLMASQHEPYDPTRGKAANVDDYIVKPFDTRKVIEKVFRLLPEDKNLPEVDIDIEVRKKTTLGFGKAAKHAQSASQPMIAVAPPAKARTTKPSLPLPPTSRKSRSSTSQFEKPSSLQASSSSSSIRSQVTSTSQGSMKSHTPVSTPLPSPSSVSKTSVSKPSISNSVAATATATATRGMENKLASMGLSAVQAQAVLELSREVVEKVVWEVVPDLAETLIREEIRRLMAE